MARTYTAADFANAQFAEHESGRAVAIRWTQDYASEPDGFWTYERPLNNKFSKEATHQEMVNMGGWVPVPTKPTITESDYSDLTNWARTWQLNGWRGRQVLADMGIEIIPDPKPANTDRLEELINDYYESAAGGPMTLAQYLDSIGITAPKED